MQELENIVKFGNSRRAVANTAANVTSSRSHAILIFNVVTQFDQNAQSPLAGRKVFAKLQIVDLAGSERGQVTENRGIRMVEGGNINKSLLALGNCINALVENSRQKRSGSNKSRQSTSKQNSNKFVGYRDSKLTRLLKDSLGGNTKTIMLACISQSSKALEETLNTLKYAQKAKMIKTTVRRNVIDMRPKFEFHPGQSTESTIIDELQDEIQMLKNKLK